MGPFLASAVNNEMASHSRIGGVPSLGLLIGLILLSFPATAQNYPISGVWVAIDPQFPTSIKETCIAVKTFGVEAVSKKSIAELVIEQRCACLSPGSAIRRHKIARHIGRTSSSIRSDLDFR